MPAMSDTTPVSLLAASVDRQGADFQVQTQQAVPVSQAFGHGLVLGGAIDQQPANGVAAITALAQRAQGRQHGGLDALGGTADEQQFAGAGADQLRCAAPHRFAQVLRDQAGAVRTAGVAKLLLHHAAGSVQRSRQYRRSGIGVEVDLGRHGGLSRRVRWEGSSL